MEILQEIGGWAGAGNIVGVGLVVLFLLTGKLRPQRAFDEMREDRDSRVAEVIAQIEVWKSALAATEDARMKLENQLQLMVEEREQTGQVVHDLLAVVRTLRPEGGGSGG